MRFYEETPDGKREEVLEDGEEKALERDANLEELSRQAGIDPEDLIEALGSNADFLAPDKIFDEISDGSSIDQTLEELKAQNILLEAELRKLESSSSSNSTLENPPLDLLAFLESQRSSKDTVRRAKDDDRSMKGKVLTVKVRTQPQDEAQPWQSHSPASTELNTLTKLESVKTPLDNLPTNHKASVLALLRTLNHPSIHTKRQKLTRRVRSRQITPTTTVWKMYLNAREGLMTIPQETSQDIWLQLWYTFALSGHDNFDRLSRLDHLGEDLRRLKIPLPFSERLLHIEAVFVAGKQSLAIHRFRSMRETVKDGCKDDLKLYRELGVRLYCLQNELHHAKSFAQAIINDSQDATDYRILIPVIRALLVQQALGTEVEAWNLYKYMRLGLGSKIEMGDYDAIVSMLLAADRANLALQVFTDMMLTRETAVRPLTLPDSTHDIGWLKLSNSIGYALKDGSKTLLSISDPRTLTKLPARCNNKFFFGKWTKKLIGDGELEGVKRVFDLMAERGMVPLAIHMNGLLGAWIREGSDENWQKAERLAWKMIYARMNFATDRALTSSGAPSSSHPYAKGVHENEQLFKVPLATMETFTILLQQYRRRQRTERFPALFDAVNKAMLPVDTVFINELLWLDTRQHHKGWVWKTYQALMDRKATQPDYVTFTILWQNMKKQEDPVIGRKSEASSDNFTTCRRLFVDLIGRTRYLRQVGKKMPRELYDLIMISFCYSRDVEGTAVALTALQRYFKISPDVSTARAVIIELARLDLVVKYGQDRRLLSNPGGRQRIEDVTKIFEVLKNKRKELLKEKGLDFEALSPELKQKESLTMLLDLLRYAFDARRGDTILTETSSRVAAERAAKEMGVPECNPWSDEKVSAQDLLDG